MRITAIEGLTLSHATSEAAILRAAGPVNYRVRVVPCAVGTDRYNVVKDFR